MSNTGETMMKGISVSLLLGGLLTLVSPSAVAQVAGPLDKKDGAAAVLPARLGEYYDAVVPDTLDLAERGKLGVHHFVSIMDEDFDYQMRWTGNPTFMAHGRAIFSICQPHAM